MKRTAIIYFKRYKLSNLHDTCGVIIKNLKDNLNFPDLPVSVDDLTLTNNAYRKAMTAARNGDRLAIAIRDDIRDKLMKQLGSNGKYVNLVSTSETMVISSGYPLSSVKKPIRLAAVRNMRLIGAPGTGKLTSKVDAAKGAKIYIHYITTDKNLPLEAWKQVAVPTSKYVFAKLQRGTLYYARVGVVGSRGQARYSDMVYQYAS